MAFSSKSFMIKVLKYMDKIDFKSTSEYLQNYFFIRGCSWIEAAANWQKNIFWLEAAAINGTATVPNRNGRIHIIYDWFKSTLKTTYYLNLEGKITKGPDLPMPLSDHAVLNINSTHAMVIGKINILVPNFNTKFQLPKCELSL